jgi:hypothetical protein
VRAAREIPRDARLARASARTATKVDCYLDRPARARMARSRSGNRCHGRSAAARSACWRLGGRVAVLHSVGDTS